MYKIKNNLSPSPISKIFHSNIQPYSLRSGSYWKNCKVRTTHYGTETIRYRGPITWELLPLSIKESKTLDEFKRKVKKWVPYDCPCRLCKTYIAGVGFID